MTIEDLKSQIDNLKALKAEWTKVQTEFSDTCDLKHYNFIRDEEIPRLMNAIYDASMNLQDAFKDTLGIYPSQFGDIAANYGYSSHPKYPCRAHVL